MPVRVTRFRKVRPVRRDGVRDLPVDRLPRAIEAVQRLEHVGHFGGVKRAELGMRRPRQYTIEEIGVGPFAGLHLFAHPEIHRHPHAIAAGRFLDRRDLGVGACRIELQERGGLITVDALRLALVGGERGVRSRREAPRDANVVRDEAHHERHLCGRIGGRQHPAILDRTIWYGRTSTAGGLPEEGGGGQRAQFRQRVRALRFSVPRAG